MKYMLELNKRTVNEPKRLLHYGEKAGWEPTAPDTTDLPQLPDGWVWASGSQLFSWSSGDSLPKKKQKDGDVAVYGGNGIQGLHNEHLVSDSTIVIGRIGAHCGNVYLSHGKAWITDNAIYGTVLPVDCDLEFLKSCFVSARLRERAKGGAQPFINQPILNATCIPLPPNGEQREIVSRLDAEISRIKTAEAACQTELARSQSLRQSILKQAFSGQLVPQDPNDEPASALLARIRAERDAEQTRSKPKRRGKGGGPS